LMLVFWVRNQVKDFMHTNIAIKNEI
jgi:hypothetical protein